jgi:hypothetical protein
MLRLHSSHIQPDRLKALIGLSWLMTIATDRPIQQKLLSFDEFFARYSDDNRYELIDGEMFDVGAD